MIIRVLLLFVLTVFSVATATAESPELFDKAIALANKKGFEITMPPYLMEHFKIPNPDKVKGREVFIPPWLMAVFQPAGSPKPQILVRLFSGDIYDNEYGVDSTKGKAWLINQERKLEQTCEWEKGHVLGPIQDGKELTDFKRFIKEMERWAIHGGIIPVPRE